MYLKTKGLKFMWMMVMFDLPTETKEERSKATGFRNFLLDSGFAMAQYSVYMRFVGTKENSIKYLNSVKNHNPGTGSVSILLFTDYQFGEIVHLYKKKPPKNLGKKPEQLMLF